MPNFPLCYPRHALIVKNLAGFYVWKSAGARSRILESGRSSFLIPIGFAEGALDIFVLALGILSLFIWPIPYFSLPVSTLAIVLGIIAQRKHKRGITAAGLVMAGIGIILTVINIVFGLLDLILKTFFRE